MDKRSREYQEEDDERNYSDEDQQPSSRRGRDNIYGPDDEERKNHQARPAWMTTANVSNSPSRSVRTVQSSSSNQGSNRDGGASKRGRVSAVFEESAVINHVRADSSVLMLVDSIVSSLRLRD